MAHQRWGKTMAPYQKRAVVVNRDIHRYDGQEVKAGTRLFVQSHWRGMLNLEDAEERILIRRVWRQHVMIWEPVVGRRYLFVADEHPYEVTVIATNVRGPGWHRVRLADGSEHGAHDRELGEIEGR